MGLYRERGSKTCGADESEGDGAPSDANCDVYDRFIDYKREIICLSWTPGCLQKGHLKCALNRRLS